MAKTKFLTEDEIIAALKKTSLTTVLVEGGDDIIIYRWVEEEIGTINVSFLPCQGRDKLLRIYLRKNEFKNKKVIFIADTDSFLYNGIPIYYNEIIWTEGYSIENDLYNIQTLESLLSTQEKNDFIIALQNFIQYYSFEYEKLKQNLTFCFNNHPNKVLTNTHILNNVFLQSVNFQNPSSNTISFFLRDYNILLRGKSLFALLLRFLSHTNRPVKHSRLSLYEHCYKNGKTPSINNIINSIRGQIT